MSTSDRKTMRVAFQGEPGAFSAIDEEAADAFLAPVEYTLAGSVVRVYDLLLESRLTIVAETILPIKHHLIGVPGATLAGLRSVASHPMALAQCEKFFLAHPHLKRIPAEDTAGSVRDVVTRGDKSAAGIAGRRAAIHYGGVILAETIQDNAENFTRFVLLLPENEAAAWLSPDARKVSLAMRLAHRPGALLASLEPFANNAVNLLKIESRP